MPPLSWQEADITVNGFQIHTYRSGGAKPPLLLAHGFTDDALCWVGLAERLYENFVLVLYYEVGHGQSSRIKDLPGLEAYDPPEHMHAVIQALNLDKPLILGHSMGAATTARFATNYPRIPRAILLEDLPWGIPTPPAGQRSFRTENEPYYFTLQSLQAQSLEEAVAYGRQQHPRWRDQSILPWAAAKHRFDLDYYQLRPPFRPNYQDLLPRISCPTLLIYGDQSLGGIITHEHARLAHSIMTDCETAHVTGAGHCIRYEQFEQYVAVVQAFLKKQMAGAESTLTTLP